MALLPVSPLVWEPADAQALRSFLDTLTGRRLAAFLLSNTPGAYMPDAKTGVTTDYVLGVVAGYERAVETFGRAADARDALARAALVNGAAAAYPDLDDPTQWPVELGGSVNAPVTTVPAV